MAEKIEFSGDVDEVAKIVGHDEEGEYLTNEVNITQDKKQFSIRIPLKFADFAKIDKEKDLFEFKLIPPEKEGDPFGIEGKLLKGKRVKKDA